MIRYGKFLKNGSTIGICAPSDGANLERIDNAENNLKKFGFNIFETGNVRNSKYLVKAKKKTRAEEFIELFSNDDIDMIISARGGEFLIDILPFIHENKDVFMNSSKYFQGFSDNSLLCFYLTTNYNLATLNGENIGEFAMQNYHECLIDNINFLTGNFNDNKFIQKSFEKFQNSYTDDSNGFITYNLDEKVEYKTLSGNKNIHIEGRILGGCIDVITQLIGTKYDNTINFCNSFKEGIIFYIDNCELSVTELYRRLIQMKNVGYFDNVNGILIGRTFANKIVYDFDYITALKKALLDLNIEVIYDVDIGHVPPQFLMINGSYGVFDLKNNSATLTQVLK